MKRSSVLLDSSVWVEILSKGPLLNKCISEHKKARHIIVPTLVLFEVYRKIASSTSEDKALSAVAHMSQHDVIDLTRDIALTAADISIENKLGMADSIILASARTFSAKLVTIDNDFAQFKDVRVLRGKL
jgi:predicted nucleic acid-binding protein